MRNNELQVSAEGLEVGPALPSLKVKENWNRGRMQDIDPKDDVQLLNMWVEERTKLSANTRGMYIREGEKLRIWMDMNGINLFTVTREQLGKYKEFLRDPPEHLIGNQRGKRGAKTEGEWRPFFRSKKEGALGGKYKPEETTVNQSFTVACALFSYLHFVGYLMLNPSAKLDMKKPEPEWRRRALSRESLKSVFEYLEMMPKDTTTQFRRYHRSRWVMQLLRLTGMRISEIQSTTMGAFESTDVGGVTRRFLTVTGKGNKKRKIPVVSELQQELGVYRKSLGLNPYPAFEEQTPLVCRIGLGEEGLGMTRQALHKLIKGMLKGTIDRLNGLDEFEGAAKLERVSAHWLRHTYGTMLQDGGASIKTGMHNMGHKKMSTFQNYSTEDEDRRWDETEKFLKPIG